MSRSEDRSIPAQPLTPAQASAAACAALGAAADQLRADAQQRRRDRVLLDVLTVDLLAVADWLDRRAWLLSVDPAAADQLADSLDRKRLDDDDELLPLDDGPAFQLGAARTAAPGVYSPEQGQL